MDLTVVRASVTGDIGGIVSIAWDPNAHGEIPREAIGVRRPRSAVGLENHAIPQSQRMPRFFPGKRNIWTARRSRVNASSPFRPHWVRGACSWSQRRKVWRSWLRAPRPIRFAFVGSNTIIDFLRGRGAGRFRPFLQWRVSASGVGASVRYVT